MRWTTEAMVMMTMQLAWRDTLVSGSLSNAQSRLQKRRFLVFRARFAPVAGSDSLKFVVGFRD